MFGEGQPQPPGRSIMLFKSWSNVSPPDPEILAGTGSYDWGRILAVVIDEPYKTALDGVPFFPHPSPDGDKYALNPCSDVPWNEERKASVKDTRTKIGNATARLHAIAPRTRLWVNFHEYEVDWMRDAECPQPLNLNDPAIDVVSLDKYDVVFSAIQSDYEWFISAMPHQQIALVPGTFYKPHEYDAEDAADILPGYFAFANRMNQRCDMGLGRVGRTGNYDGCRVWAVVGWFNGTGFIQHGITYRGLFHPESTEILEAWRTQHAKTPSFWPRTLSARDMRALELVDE